MDLRHFIAWPKRLRREITLLVADDDESCRLSLMECFDQPGFRVISAEDGTQAVEILSQRHLDFTVMDIHMPGLTGIEVLRHLRHHGRMLPCIFVSAAASRDVRDQAISVGAFSLVEKPVRLDQLRTSVHELLLNVFERTSPLRPHPGIVPAPKSENPESGGPWIQGAFFPKDPFRPTGAEPSPGKRRSDDSDPSERRPHKPSNDGDGSSSSE